MENDHTTDPAPDNTDEVIVLGHTVIGVEDSPADVPMLARVADALREMP